MTHIKGIWWSLECGHDILCGCNHYVGLAAYCIHCSVWTKIVDWSYVKPVRAEGSSADEDLSDRSGTG